MDHTIDSLKYCYCMFSQSITSHHDIECDFKKKGENVHVDKIKWKHVFALTAEILCGFYFGSLSWPNSRVLTRERPAVEVSPQWRSASKMSWNNKLCMTTFMIHRLVFKKKNIPLKMVMHKDRRTVALDCLKKIQNLHGKRGSLEAKY